MIYSNAKQHANKKQILVALGMPYYQTQKVSEYVGILEVEQYLVLMMNNTRVVEFAILSRVGLKHRGNFDP